MAGARRPYDTAGATRRLGQFVENPAVTQRRVLLHTPDALPLVTILPKAWAQSCPYKPVRGVVPFAPGNTLDTALRRVAEAFKVHTGQQLLVDAKSRETVDETAGETVDDCQIDGARTVQTLNIGGSFVTVVSFVVARGA